MEVGGKNKGSDRSPCGTSGGSEEVYRLERYHMSGVGD